MGYVIKQSFMCGFLGWNHLLVILRSIEVTQSAFMPWLLPMSPSLVFPGCHRYIHLLSLTGSLPLQANILPGIVPTYFFLACGIMGLLLRVTDSGNPDLWHSVVTTALCGNLLVLNQVIFYLIYEQLRCFCRKELYGLPIKARPIGFASPTVKSAVLQCPSLAFPITAAS